MERMTFDEMKKKYKDEWLLIRDCEINENTELVCGMVIDHDPRRSVIHKKQLDVQESEAVLYAGEIAKDEVFML
ncbi:MAG: hypothetical protein J7M27_05370 [Candidatus Latescibacteria bacterium]|nr:hypothetical protein [Candidatus Latescibacterota bacterium]